MGSVRATMVLGLGQKRQAKLADLHLVAVDQHRRIHRLPVDVGAVEATDRRRRGIRRSPTETPRAGGSQ